MTISKDLKLINEYIQKGKIKREDLNKLNLLIAITRLESYWKKLGLNKQGKLEFKGE